MLDLGIDQQNCRPLIRLIPSYLTPPPNTLITKIRSEREEGHHYQMYGIEKELYGDTMNHCMPTN